jgi:tRNA-specific 2-thiouridylase
VKYDRADNIKVTAKIRYRHKEASGVLRQIDEDKIKVIFDEPQKAIAPGQSLVAYEDDSLVVGGIII